MVFFYLLLASVADLGPVWHGSTSLVKLFFGASAP